MTTGLQNSSSAGANPAVSALTNSMSGSSRRADKATGSTPGQSFSQMLQQQQTAALAPPPSLPAQQAVPQPSMSADVKPHGSGDQSASRLAERQSNARQMEAAQQASRDAQAAADRSAQSRRDEAKAHEDGKSGSGQGSSSQSSESKPGSKAQAAGHHHHHAHHAAHADKAKDAQAKKAVKGEESDAKTAAKKAGKGDDATAASPATPGAQPAEATSASAAGTEAKGVAAQPGEVDSNPLGADAGSALMGKHGAGATHGLLGKGGKGGTDLAATAAAGQLDAKATADAAAAKTADALAADAKAAPQAAAAESKFADTLKAMGADQEALGGQNEAHRPGQESNAAARIDGPSGAAGLMGAAGTHQGTQQTAEAPPPQQIMFATPIHSPDFGQSLGISITSLAQNGVHEAQLHLNPAETGPISIQITVDGTAAQIDFQAANAHTRDAIYAGMPELAAALNAAGLTLTGGGVSEHSRGNQAFQEQFDRASNNGNAQGTRTASIGGVDDDLAAPRVTRSIARPTQGAVDLYA